MKIKLNAIGFGNKQQILRGEGLIALGLILTAAGLIYIRRTQEWVCANGNEHAIDFMMDVFNELRR